MVANSSWQHPLVIFDVREAAGWRDRATASSCSRDPWSILIPVLKNKPPLHAAWEFANNEPRSLGNHALHEPEGPLS